MKPASEIAREILAGQVWEPTPNQETPIGEGHPWNVLMSRITAAIEAEREENSVLRDKLFELKSWMAYKLETDVIHVSVESAGSHPRGWAAVRFPDWDVKQKISEIDACISTEPPK